MQHQDNEKTNKSSQILENKTKNDKLEEQNLFQNYKEHDINDNKEIQNMNIPQHFQFSFERKTENSNLKNQKQQSVNLKEVPSLSNEKGNSSIKLNIPHIKAKIESRVQSNSRKFNIHSQSSSKFKSRDISPQDKPPLMRRFNQSEIDQLDNNTFINIKNVANQYDDSQNNSKNSKQSIQTIGSNKIRPIQNQSKKHDIFEISHFSNENEIIIGQNPVSVMQTSFGLGAQMQYQQNKSFKNSKQQSLNSSLKNQDEFKLLQSNMDKPNIFPLLNQSHYNQQKQKDKNNNQNIYSLNHSNIINNYFENDNQQIKQIQQTQNDDQQVQTNTKQHLQRSFVSNQNKEDILRQQDISDSFEKYKNYRKSTSKEQKDSHFGQNLEKILSMGDDRANGRFRSETARNIRSNDKAQRKTLVQVAKQASTLGFGQSIVGSVIHSQLSLERDSIKQQMLENLNFQNMIKEYSIRFNQNFLADLDWNFILGELESEENLFLNNFLKTLPCPITFIKDIKGLNLLHHAVQKGVEGKTKLLIEYAKNKQQLSQEVIVDWINSKTLGEGWTPLHYASFQGNIGAIYTLVEFGANIEILNNNGLNMLHVAAQGDTAPTLYMFKELGIDLNAQDMRGSTPIHWACYSQSETALAYLLAWNPDVNIQDKEGYTPLHLAVRSVDALESCRPVRALLIKGASTNIRDKKGNLPFDYVRDVKTRSFVYELHHLLRQNSSICHLLTGQTPIQKVQKTTYTLIAFYIIYLSVFLMKYTQLYQRQSQIQNYIAYTSDLLTLFIHIFLINIEPGYLVNDQIDFMNLLETFDPSSLCPECKTIRTARSRHCIICHKCVERYDHHCPWINNCVGIRNHNTFLTYLMSQIVTLFISIYQSVLLMIEYFNDSQKVIDQSHNQFDAMLDKFKVQNIKEIVFVIQMVLILFICLLFALPMLKLIHVQICNFLNSKTTNERFSRMHLQNQVEEQTSGNDSDIIDSSDLSECQQQEQYDNLKQNLIQGRFNSFAHQSQRNSQQQSKYFNDSYQPSFLENQKENQGQTQQKQNSIYKKLQQKTQSSQEAGKKQKQSQNAFRQGYNNCLEMCYDQKAGLNGKRQSQREIFQQHTQTYNNQLSQLQKLKKSNQ